MQEDFKEDKDAFRKREYELENKIKQLKSKNLSLKENDNFKEHYNLL